MWNAYEHSVHEVFYPPMSTKLDCNFTCFFVLCKFVLSHRKCIPNILGQCPLFCVWKDIYSFLYYIMSSLYLCDGAWCWDFIINCTSSNVKSNPSVTVPFFTALVLNFIFLHNDPANGSTTTPHVQIGGIGRRNTVIVTASSHYF